jgi:hypothetical protein
LRYVESPPNCSRFVDDPLLCKPVEMWTSAAKLQHENKGARLRSRAFPCLKRPNQHSLSSIKAEQLRMAINVRGAGVGRQFVGRDPDRCEWRVSYEIDGRGTYYHTVSARDSQEAIEIAKRELGQAD